MRNWWHFPANDAAFVPVVEHDAWPTALASALGKVTGFSLHAGVATRANERDKLERLCRYIARPAVSTKRLSLTRNGQVRYELKTPWRNGTTHVLFEPLDFIARLVALAPAKPAWRFARSARSLAGVPISASPNPESTSPVTIAQARARVRFGRRPRSTRVKPLRVQARATARLTRRAGNGGSAVSPQAKKRSRNAESSCKQ
jgi:hypothetical protein